MTLQELKAKIDLVLISAKECGESPLEIPVSLQIDGPNSGGVWANEIEVYYDNNIQAFGCVLVGSRIEA